MKGKYLKTTFACLIGTVTISGFTMSVGATNLNTNIPSAGMAIALNNYFEDYNKVESDILGLLNPIVTQAKTSKPDTSFYDSLAISQVNDYVNVRSEASTESDIVGKIYNNCAATILGQEGEWYKIESGNVSGYIKAEYFITGEAAEVKAREVGYVNATVKTTTLNVREDQAAEGRILAQLGEGESCDVIEYGDGWANVNVDASTKGWVSLDYVDIDVVFETAITLEEEEAKRAEEARLAEEARVAEARARQAQTSQSRTSTSNTSQATQASQSAPAAPSSNSSSASSLRQAVVAYAMQFNGNPYVYGGTSLTNGTDCSGFTMSIYKHFGYNITRTSTSQRSAGVAVSLNNLLPGDIICYTGHVGLYIGDGQIIHAATPALGIRVQGMYYRQPLGARRIIN